MPILQMEKQGRGSDLLKVARLEPGLLGACSGFSPSLLLSLFLYFLPPGMELMPVPGPGWVTRPFVSGAAQPLLQLLRACGQTTH